MPEPSAPSGAAMRRVNSPALRLRLGDVRRLGELHSAFWSAEETNVWSFHSALSGRRRGPLRRLQAFNRRRTPDANFESWAWLISNKALAALICAASIIACSPVTFLAMLGTFGPCRVQIRATHVGQPSLKIEASKYLRS